MQNIIHVRSHFGEVAGLYIEAQTCLHCVSKHKKIEEKGGYASS